MGRGGVEMPDASVAPMNYGEIFLKGFGTLLTLTVMGMSVLFVYQANAVGRPDNRFFLTGTFLTAYKSHLPGLTWSPAADVRSVAGLTEGAHRCLQVARVGESLCPALSMNTDRLPEYTACLQRVYGFGACVQLAVQGLTPSVLRFQPSAGFFGAVWTCASTARLGVTNANHIAYDACTDATGDGALEVLQDPYSDVFLGSVNWVMAFGTGLWILSSFAVYSAWFANDSVEFLNGRVDGKPGSRDSYWRNMFARGGWLVTVVGLLWNILALVPIGTLAWRVSGDTQAATNDSPMSVQTTLVCMFFLLLSVVYFAGELWDQVGIAWGDPGVAAQARVPPVTVYGQIVLMPGADGAMVQTGFASRMENGMRSMRMIPSLQGHMRAPTGGWGKATSAYTTPLFVFAWGDAWVLTDALLMVGVVCTSMDVVTAELCNVFLLTLYASVLHAAMQRLLYNGYVCEDDDDKNPELFRRKTTADLAEDESLAGVRVMALLSNVGSLTLVVTSLSLIWFRYAQAGNTSLSGLTTAYLVLVSLVPALMWLVLNLLQEMGLSAVASAKKLSRTVQKKRTGAEVAEVDVTPHLVFDHLMYAQLAFDWGLMLRIILTIILYSAMITWSESAVTANARLGTLITKWGAGAEL